MKLEKEILIDHQAKFTVNFEPDVFEKYKNQAARKISSKTKIAGFRPGKAPYEVVRRNYGDETIENEAIELIVNDYYPKIIKDARIKPYGPGRLEKIVNKNPLSLIFVTPLEAEVILGDYYSISMKYAPASVQEEDIQKVIRRLQLDFATAESVERAIQKGDLVGLKLNAKLLKPAEGENPDIIKDSPMQIIIDDKELQEDNFPFIGFDDKLIDMQLNEEKVVIYTYPEDSEYEKLKGKEVEFLVLIQSIKALIKPELNDDFAKTVGKHESFRELHNTIKKQLEEEKIRRYDRDFYNELINKIISKSILKYPPQMLEEETQFVLRNFEQELAAQNLDLSTYLKINKFEKVKFIEEEIQPAAKNQVEQSLVLQEINKQEKIELEKNELQQEYSKNFMEIQRTSDYKKLRRQFTTKGLANHILLQTASRLMNKRVTQRLKDIVTGKINRTPEKQKDQMNTNKKVKLNNS